MIFFTLKQKGQKKRKKIDIYMITASCRTTKRYTHIGYFDSRLIFEKMSTTDIKQKVVSSISNQMSSQRNPTYQNYQQEEIQTEQNKTSVLAFKHMTKSHA